MDIELFEKAGIEVRFQDFHCPVYSQQWAKNTEDFLPNLSMLDLLFSQGPGSLKILMGKTGK